MGGVRERVALIGGGATSALAVETWRRTRALLTRERAAEWVARLPQWARSWPLWLVLGTAALLRLAGIARSPFGSDDALSFLVVARAAHSHLLPITGEFDSILALEPPAYSYFILPFANHAFGAALLTALANTLAVGGVYVLTERYFGRIAALGAGLFFATAGYDTWMSEFLWPPTLGIPVALAAFAFLLRGVVERRRWWLAPHLILLALAIQLHPINAALLPLTLLAGLLAWRTLALLDVLLGLAGAALLFLPTVIFEIASHGLDLPAYQAWLALPKHTDAQIFQSLATALAPLPGDYFGPTAYTSIAPAFGWLAPAVDLLWVAGTLWLLGTVIVPLVRAVRQRGEGRVPPGEAPSGGPHHRTPLQRSLHALLTGREARAWRARVLLLLWPLALIALTLRHATPVYPQYIFVLTPVIYITIGVFLAEAPRAAARWVRRRFSRLPARAVVWPLRTVGGMVLACQALVTAVLIVVFATGQGWGWSWSGIPIASYEQALARATETARGLGASQVYIAADPGDPYMGLYWAQRENNLAGVGDPAWTSYVGGDCALSPGTGAGVVLVTDGSGLALRHLLAEAGTRRLATLSVARGIAYPLYALAPEPAATSPLATVNGELRLEAAVVAPAGNGLPARLVLRWRVMRSTPPGPAVAEYAFHLLFSRPGGRLDLWAHCAPSVWTAGEALTTVTALPPQVAVRGDWHLSVIVSRDTHTWYQPRFGALTFETAKELTRDYVVLPLGEGYGPGLAAPSQNDLNRATIAVPVTGL